MSKDEKIMEIDGQIIGLKQLLAASDYKALKFAEGEIPEDEYAETKEYRQSLRDKINELEAEREKIQAEEDAAE